MGAKRTDYAAGRVLLRPTHHNHKHMIRQRPLQRFGFVPRRVLQTSHSFWGRFSALSNSNLFRYGVFSIKGKKARMKKNKAPDTQNVGSSSRPQMQASNPKMLNPGDEAAPGTPGAGEDVCPECQGKGRIDGSSCPNCGGSGTIIRGVGGG